MNPNNSPWIKELKRSRPVSALTENTQTQIAVVGGGISGVTTAYFLLKHTNKKVMLIEATKVAHGATGHNAGQITSYFERQISDIAQEFGIEKTAAAQRHVHSAWDLLEDIYREAKLQIPLSQFAGYAGCKDIAEILVHLKNNIIAHHAHLPIERMKIARESDVAKEIPPKYADLYTLVPHAEILEKLETTDPTFIALITARKGCLNSALFSEEVTGYLLATYPERFSLAEESPVSELILNADVADLKIKDLTVTAEQVVLCTNGFEKFKIINNAGADIDPKFHYLVRGSVGYMAAYLEDEQRDPVAISYLPRTATEKTDAFNAEPYFLLTRRPFENDKSGQSDLICVAGPEELISDTNSYSKEKDYPETAQKQIDGFLHNSYIHAPKGEIDYKYKWHGLMGYTPNGIRLIGREPINPILLYNLGCNGIGILPSIYGARRISQIIAGENLEPSIFDPKNQNLPPVL